MNLWRRVTTELAGAWRSLRYDLGRRPAFPDSRPGPDRGPDVTCTGLSTFAGPIEDGPIEVRTGYDEFGRPPRPLAAVSVFVLLAVVGAVASYFAVVNGLGSLLREKPAAPGSYPLADGAPAATRDTSNSGLGRAGGQVTSARGTPVPAILASTPAIPPAAATPGTGPGGSATSRTATPPRRTPPERGVTPPVPTPTAPSPDPSTGPSPSPSGSPSAAGSPTASPSGTPPPEPPTGGPSGPAAGANKAAAYRAGADDEALPRPRHRPAY